MISTLRPTLFHGSRYPGAILKANELTLPTSGYPMISLTRDVRIARYWASLKRDDDEGRGAIFVLDRVSLGARFRLSPFRDQAWHEGRSRCEQDEAEEVVWARPIDRLATFLIEVRWLETPC
ncbi:MAG: hypothetical protein DI533_21720 [Cereibacter sphaeroides]|uniref:Uncharacterized protein n=1 Tax=Cereibacter sphaeroides TaxID=1063 RepID=A0A2W5TV74_CERSP|nr:MAG: hypothetical protein DI533_21720 [Cereibacter sphaeroides]